MARFLSEFPIPGQGTFFCHQPFPSLDATRHELCPHPFVSDLFQWQAPLGMLRQEINPRARGVRTHSCVFSHMVGVGLHEMGFDYVSQANNLYEPKLRPFRHPWGVWEMPIYYMDNMDFWMNTNWPGLNHEPFSRRVIETAVHGTDLYVFDFHPIHIALNTRTAEDYQRVKAAIVDHGASPFDLAVDGSGTRTFFEELCVRMVDAGLASRGCSDALDAYAARDTNPMIESQ